MTELRTKPEAAKLLRVSVRKLDYLMAEGRVRPVRIGRRVLFTDRELEAYIASRQRAA